MNKVTQLVAATLSGVALAYFEDWLNRKKDVPDATPKGHHNINAELIDMMCAEYNPAFHAYAESDKQVYRDRMIRVQQRIINPYIDEILAANERRKNASVFVKGAELKL